MLEALGIKPSVAIAGFVGGVLSLQFLKDLTPQRASLALLGGAACAAYLTPLAVQYFELGQQTEHASAFILGLTSMNTIAAIMKLSENVDFSRILKK